MIKGVFLFFWTNWLVFAAAVATGAGFVFGGFFGAVAGVPLIMLDWSLKLGAILREIRRRGEVMVKDRYVLKKLEDENAEQRKENESFKKYADGLEKEIKSLREALAFYAEMTGNEIQLYGDMDSEALEFDDGESFPFGKKARDALKGAGNDA